MATSFDVLLDCLHCDDTCYSDLKTLEEVILRCESLSRERLSDSRGLVIQEITDEDLERLRVFVYKSWDTYENFWEDVYD